jgi:uncharacterized protein (TIGR03066 family)
MSEVSMINRVLVLGGAGFLGKVHATREGKGRLNLEGTDKLDDNKLQLTLKVNGKELVKSWTVAELTDTELRIETETGTVDSFTRIKEQ